MLYLAADLKKPELTCISEEGIADMDLPDNILDELEYLDNITSCNKVRGEALGLTALIHEGFSLGGGYLSKPCYWRCKLTKAYEWPHLFFNRCEWLCTFLKSDKLLRQLLKHCCWFYQLFGLRVVVSMIKSDWLYQLL